MPHTLKKHANQFQKILIYLFPGKLQPKINDFRSISLLLWSLYFLLNSRFESSTLLSCKKINAQFYYFSEMRAHDLGRAVSIEVWLLIHTNSLSIVLETSYWPISLTLQSFSHMVLMTHIYIKFLLMCLLTFIDMHAK